jgi:mRNA interferase RelE/StbE
MYEIEVSPAAERDLEKLGLRIQKYDFELLKMAIRDLSEEPRPQGVRKIKGAKNAYRIRVRSYRIVYDVFDNKQLVLILLIARCTETTYH